MDRSPERNWLARFCRDHLAELVVGLLLLIATGIGSAVYSCAGTIDSLDKNQAVTNVHLETLVKSLDELNNEAKSLSTRIGHHDAAISAHAARLTGLEAAKR